MLEALLVLAAAVADAFRPRWALLTEIALLRHQIAVLQRSVARPRVARFDRVVLVVLAAVTPTWRDVLRIVQPATLLRWHRGGFKALWRESEYSTRSSGARGPTDASRRPADPARPGCRSGRADSKRGLRAPEGSLRPRTCPSPPPSSPEPARGSAARLPSGSRATSGRSCS